MISALGGDYNEDAPSNKLEQVYEETSLKGGGKAC